MVFNGDVFYFSVNGNGGVVHPRVEAAELANGEVGDVLYLLRVTDVSNDVFRLSATRANFFGQFAQRTLCTRRQHEPRTAFRREACRDQTDAARWPRDHDYLFR